MLPTCSFLAEQKFARLYTSPEHKIPPYMIKAPFHLSDLQLIALSTTHMLNKYVTLAIAQNMSVYGEQLSFAC